jgi:hypothetical protein
MDTSFLSSPKMIAVAIVVMLGAGAGVWGLTRSRGEPEPPKVAVPKEFEVETLKQADPRQGFDVMRQAMERQDLTDEQRRQIGENMREVWEARMDQRIDEYFKAPEDKRKELLDRDIDEMQERWKEMERRRAENPPDPNREQNRDRMRGMWGGGNPSREERKTRSESRNPDQRARRMAYRHAMENRMAERGIQRPQWGGPGGPRGRS